ncbi:MAG: chemotaxis response regulator protein-glutamate methylesterase [bacterium]
MCKVLVIDDSLFMRSLIPDMLNSDPEIEVIGTAKDGEDAIKKIPKIKPDCITLDLAMPGWDGLTTLEHIMAKYPTPVVILSAYSKKDADITMKCLNAGAVSFVLKPSGEMSLDIESVKHELIKQVKIASRVRLANIKPLIRKEAQRTTNYELRTTNSKRRIIVIGASTGGPQTLEKVLSSLPVNLVLPVIIVQHAPSLFFTESLTEHLRKACDLEVKVAEDKETLRAGTIYFAPAGFETRIVADKNTDNRRLSAKIRIENPRKSALSPSIDITMESAAAAYKENTIGIILTGMGRDGLQGMRAIKACGGATLVQDESSLIFGMPKEVIDAGLADKVLPVERIADEIMELV